MNQRSHERAMNRSMPDCSIIPVLTYPDVEEATAWLCKTFGFSKRWQAGNHRAQLSFGDGAIAISGASGEQEMETTTALSHSLMVRVPDLASHYEKARQYAQILQTPADYPYGERQYSAKDIGGHHWTFSQTIRDVAPDEWGGVSDE